MFWQPGVVNIAPSVDARCSAGSTLARGGEIGLAGEWKPAVAKKSPEKQQKDKPTLTSAISDGGTDCQPTSTGQGVTGDQPGSDLTEKHTHSLSSCIEMEEQWSDVEPMSPCDRTPSAVPVLSVNNSQVSQVGL